MAEDRPAPAVPIRSILIVGGGAAGWMTAAVLARTLPPQLYRIGLVDSPDGPSGLAALDTAQASLPPLASLHQFLGIPDDLLLRGVDATYSLGASLAGFSRPGASYWRTFGRFGSAMEGIAFHNLWDRARRKGLTAPLADHSLAAVAAGLGRFAPPVMDGDPLLSSYDHGWHLDGLAYRKLLRLVGERAGVVRIEGDVGEVALRGADGFIEAVVLRDGQRFEADLFIDCTADGRLIEGALGSGWEDWSEWLPCDRIVAARSAREGDPPPCWQAQAHAAGWDWRIPLGKGDGVGRVYASSVISDDEAAAGLDGTLARFTSGRRRAMWVRNCIAMGEAACVLDPLVPTALQIVQDGIAHFLTLIPRLACDGGEADEYNRLMSETVERMRDFVILHYKANTRTEPFWAERRAMAVPDLLAHKMRLFEASGRVIEWDEESFFEADWVGVYFGQEVRPRHYDALADVPDGKAIRARMAEMRARIQAAALAMPTHRAFIDAQLSGGGR